MPYTKGFNSATALALHFRKHGALLGVATEAEYLAMADTFLGGPLENGAVEGTRTSDHARLRFHEVEQRFGVLFSDNVICTFYKFDPPPRDLNWFNAQCAK